LSQNSLNIRQNGYVDLFWPCITLTFDLRTTKAYQFMPLPVVPLVPSCIKIGSFVFKISCSKYGKWMDDPRHNVSPGKSAMADA